MEGRFCDCGLLPPASAPFSFNKCVYCEKTEYKYLIQKTNLEGGCKGAGKQ